MCSVRCLIVPYICVKFGKNISEGISYGADMNDGSTDRQMDRWMDGRTYQVIPFDLSLIFIIPQHQFFNPTKQM